MGKLIYHRKTNSLLIPERDPSRITQYIPRSRVVNIKGRTAVQVRLGLDEARVLRNLGISAPSPIRYDYTWPSRYPSAMSHQVATSEFLTLYRRSMCLNDPGTGKTLSVLWALDYLMLNGHIRKAVVACPKSILGVWRDECEVHLLYRRKIVVLKGSRQQKLQLLEQDADIYVLNHDALKTLNKELRARKDIDALVVDEASEGFRNAKTARYEALELILKSNPEMWLWLLTGTPTSRSPTDAWAYGRLIGNPTCPRYYGAFRDEVMLKLTEYKWVPKPNAYSRAFEIMQPGIRFRKQDCVDLPPVTYQTHRCELTPEQEAAAKRMVTKLVMEAQGQQITAANAAVKLGKVLQICAGVVYDNEGNPVTVDCKPRLELCEELVSQTPRKSIVFVPFRGAMNMVTEYLRSKGHTVEQVHGDVSAADRDRIFSAFQMTDTPEVLVCHPKTTAHGLTLTEADTTIWYSPTHSAEMFDQGNSRMDRPGQKFHMGVHMLAGHPIEFGVYAALQGKRRMQDCVLELFRNLGGNI